MKPGTASGDPGVARQTLWTVAACAAILIAVIAAWSNSFNGAFIFDDLVAIQDNPTLRHFPRGRVSSRRMRTRSPAGRS